MTRRSLSPSPSRRLALLASCLAVVAGGALHAQSTKDRPQVPSKDDITREVKKEVQKAKDTIATPKPGQEAAPAMQLPPGWTEEDMMKVVAASTPGPMHAHLAKGAGVWLGKNTMWMAPDSEPVMAECVATVKPIMDGRFVAVEFKGDMPGMGPFSGYGIHGYDNVAERFVSTWIDNHGTGMMRGTGELSSDGSTLTWTYDYTCPITGKPTAMREIERIVDENTKTLEMWGRDPKSGREYRMMTIELRRKA